MSTPKVEAYECSGDMLVAFVNGQWKVYKRDEGFKPDEHSWADQYPAAWRYVAKVLGLTP